MLSSKTSNKQPGLWLVSTPIGNLEDITLRALNVLKDADIIYAEDTRHCRKLLSFYQIDTVTKSLHEHNEQNREAEIMENLAQHKMIAIVSDAGTPVINDPGFLIVKAARAKGFIVSCTPGPCALIAALSISGISANRFIFEGFFPAKETTKTNLLRQLKAETATVIFYESCHRILNTLNHMLVVLDGNRQIVVARELTKQFETIYQGSIADVSKTIASASIHQKGEFVVLVKGVELQPDELIIDNKTTQLLTLLNQELPASKAAKIAAEISGINRRDLYQYLQVK